MHDCRFSTQILLSFNSSGIVACTGAHRPREAPQAGCGTASGECMGSRVRVLKTNGSHAMVMAAGGRARRDHRGDGDGGACFCTCAHAHIGHHRKRRCWLPRPNTSGPKKTPRSDGPFRIDTNKQANKQKQKRPSASRARKNFQFPNQQWRCTEDRAAAGRTGLNSRRGRQVRGARRSASAPGRQAGRQVRLAVR